jgi:seryl-tRNA synthetase
LDGVLRRTLDGKKRGLTWRLKESLEDMEYADDIFLVSHKYEHMQKKLDDLQEESKEVGLQINPLKTEEIRVNTIINTVFKLNGEEIKKITRFLLLGQCGGLGWWSQVRC